MDRTIVALFIGLLLLGCTANPQLVQAQLGKNFTLKVNQTASIASEGLIIKLDGVTQDSRCPSDVVCVWAGEVQVKLLLSKGEKSGLLQPVLGASAGNESEGEFEGYKIKLVSVEPYPVSTKQIAQSDYNVTLTVEKE